MTAVIGGYAVKFDTISSLVPKGGYRERVRPGAFTESLRSGREVWATVNHDMSQLLGRRSSGSLKVAQDKVGLAYAVSAPPTSVGRDTVALITRGDMPSSSFAFRAVDEEWEQIEGVMLRSVNKANVIDVGPTLAGVYPSATAMTGEVADWPVDSGVLPAELLSLRSLLATVEDRSIRGVEMDPTTSWATYVTAVYHPPVRDRSGVRGGRLRKFHTNNLDEARAYADRVAVGVEARSYFGSTTKVGSVVRLHDGSTVAVLRSKSGEATRP